MTSSRGYRGYIASRSICGNRIPQHVQNLVIRDYAARHDLHYLLSTTELSPDACLMALEGALAELNELDGIIAYSIFMLPEGRSRRQDIYRRVLDAGATLHSAVEEVSLTRETDITRIEDLFLIRQTMVGQADIESLIRSSPKNNVNQPAG